MPCRLPGSQWKRAMRQALGWQGRGPWSGGSQDEVLLKFWQYQVFCAKNQAQKFAYSINQSNAG